MLRGDKDALDLDRHLVTALVLLVADRDLRLAVRTEVRDDAGLPHLGEPPADLVRERDWKRHQLLGLAARKPEHHPLIAGSEPIERVLVARAVCRLVRG